MPMHAFAFLLFLGAASTQDVPFPVPVDGRLKVELVAREPVIRTPVGVSVDPFGRIWAIESNSHFRPKDYPGHPTDRILMFDDFGPEGRARRIVTFADGFKYGMGLAVRENGDVFFATRWEVLRLRDTDADDRADERTLLVKLDTKGDYPHNGLCGFAFDEQGRMYFGMGENLGAPYRLVGSDGTVLAGGGEGGNVYRCNPDGSGLMLLSTGFWNPFHMDFDAFGRLFVVDNDPDSRPPNRLLHVVPGGDFGFRFRNGRKGLHPFTAWNGELPGTLPMAAGTGEGVSGVLAYEHESLPEDYRGSLIATSWGDHLLQKFTLASRGGSVAGRAETIVKGTENFRPVGIALAPDGSIVITDWVDRSYPLHGKGRIWRIRAKDPSPATRFERDRARELLSHPRRDFRRKAGALLALRAPSVLEEVLRGHSDSRARLQALWSGGLAEQAIGDAAPEVRGEAARLLAGRDDLLLPLVKADPAPFVRMQAVLSLARAESMEALLPLLKDADPFVLSAVIETLSRRATPSFLRERFKGEKEAGRRLGLLLALRRQDEKTFDPAYLEDPDAGVRRAAIQWVGEAGLTDQAERLAAIASRPPVTPEIFEAFLAANGFLDARLRKEADKAGRQFYIVRVLNDEKQPAALRALALRMLPPNHALLTVKKLRGWAASTSPELRLEAVRILSDRPDEAAQVELRRIAVDRGAGGEERRLEAIRGLAHSSASSADSRDVLVAALGDDDAAVRGQALRSLVGSASRPRVRAALEKIEGERAALVLGRAIDGRPTDVAGWRKAVEGAGDAAEGARVFFHPKGPQCYVCHRVNGRGGVVGPDLSTIGRVLDRTRLIESILEPSKEVAPMFVGWKVATKAGEVHDGRLLGEDPATGAVTLIDAKGRITRIPRDAIRARKPSDVSLMPAKLYEVMTRQEFRDLIRFLAELK